MRVSRSLILICLKHSVFRQKLPTFTSLVLVLSLAGGTVWADESTHPPVDRTREPSEDLDPPPHAQQEEAIVLIKEKKWDEALLKLRAIVKENPSDLPAQIRLAHVLLQLGRREEAISTLAQRLRLIRLHPREKTPGRIENEKKLLQRQISVMSRLFLTNATLQIYQAGIQQIKLKKYSLAREKFEKAYQAEPDQLDVMVRLAQLDMMEQNYDRAAERLKAAHRMNPDEPMVRLWLARALYERGERSEALTEFRETARELKGNELHTLWWAEASHALNGDRGTRVDRDNAKENLYAESLALLAKDLKENPLHLAVAAMYAKFRLLSIGVGGERAAADRYKGAEAPNIHNKENAKHLQLLQTIRNDLQQALKQHPEYVESFKKRASGDLDFEVIDPAQIKENLQALLDQVEAKLSGQIHLVPD